MEFFVKQYFGYISILWTNFDYTIMIDCLGLNDLQKPAVIKCCFVSTTSPGLYTSERY